MPGLRSHTQDFQLRIPQSAHGVKALVFATEFSLPGDQLARSDFLHAIALSASHSFVHARVSSQVPQCSHFGLRSSSCLSPDAAFGCSPQDLVFSFGGR
jgi:hypothetical protein